MKKKRKREWPAFQAHEPFTLKQRAIYRYFDGEKEVARDPLAILRALNGRPGMPLDADVKLALSPVPESSAAFGRLVESVRDAFGAKPFEEVEGRQRGLTVGECLALLLHFGQFIKGIQNAAVPFVTSPFATGPPPSAESVTASSPGFTSTATAPSCNGG
jgi:hypothetical protein